jgi:hypothetical protein
MGVQSRVNLRGINMRNTLGVLILFAASTVHAIPVTWTAVDITFVSDFGPATLTGTFDYDADTDEYSNLNLVIPEIHEYSGLPGHGVFTGPVHAGRPYEFGMLDDASLMDTHLTFATDLTGEGGVVQISSGYFYDDPSTYEGEVSGGSVSAVPIPAAVWLFGSALAGLGWIRRRSQS